MYRPHLSFSLVITYPAVALCLLQYAGMRRTSVPKLPVVDSSMCGYKNGHV